MAFFRQLRLLLWKNATLRKREPVKTTLEIFMPLFLFIILALVRSRGLKENMPACHYKAKPLPSSGILPFLQGFACNFNNTCYGKATQSESPGLITSFNNSLVTQAVLELEGLLRDNQVVNDIDTLTKDITNLQNFMQIVNSSRMRNSTQDIVTRSLTLGSIINNVTAWRAALMRQNVTFTDEAWGTLTGASINARSILANLSSISMLPLLFSNFSQILSGSPWMGLLPALTGGDLKALACNKSSVLYSIIRYESTNETDLLEEMLCNRSAADLLAIYSTARSRINTTAITEEASRIILNVTGKPIASTTQLYYRMRNLTMKISQQKSLMELMRHLIDIGRSMYNQFPIPGTGNANNSSSNSTMIKNLIDAMNLFCGPSPEGNDISRLLTQIENDQKGNFGDLSGAFDSKRRRKRSVSSDDVTQRLFCSSLSKSLSKPPYKYIWRQMRTILFGKILYTPDTPLTRRIVQAANTTFDQLALIHNSAKRWLNIYSGQLFRFLMLDPNVNALREVVSTCAKGSLPGLNASLVSLCKQMDDFLYKGLKRPGKVDWRDYLRRVDAAVNQLRLFTGCFEYDKFFPVKNESEMVRLGMIGIKLGWYWAGVVFDDAPENPSSKEANVMPSMMNIRIRMDVDKVDSTRYFKVLDRYWRPKPRDRPLPDLKYFTYGFIYLQEMLERGVMTIMTGGSIDEGIYMQQFPYPCYVMDKFTRAISGSLPLFMVLAWIFAVSITVRSIVYEKELRLKEFMRVMGLSNGVHWVAWFITTFIILLISVLLMLVILKAGKVLEFSDTSVIFVFLVSFLIATMMQSFLISVFFSKANLAAACGGLIYFVCYLPYTLVQLHEENITETALTGLSLFCQVAFGIGCQYLARFEEQGTGAQWNNLWTNPAPDDSYNMGKTLLMMWCDVFIYGLLTWYIEAVFPGKYGVPRRWYFPVQRSYWCSKPQDSDWSDGGCDDDHVTMEMPTRDNPDNFEEDPMHMKVGVSIRNLRKTYRGPKKKMFNALDGLSMNFYEDQITSFLGHNGAGKTTTMSILTGLYTPTSGTASIYGHDIRTEMDSIRHHVGLCPQYNVLFDNLTVEEHIWFYGLLKGISSEAIDKEIERYVHEVGLPHKRDDVSRSLSGGMKRKLSVAMAFVGGSKVIILDEPTAGVDPYARRSIWDILLKCRRDRTIILTTHHMDEADVLGDRIAIIAQGRLKCCGSSFFLKNRFGNGYYLTLVKSEADRKNNQEGHENFQDDQDENHSETCRSANLEKLTCMVTEHIPDAKLHEEVSTEITYVLPYESIHRGDINKLLCDLELNGNTHGIDSFGLSDSTLEEVFLSVAEDPSDISPEGFLREGSNYEDGRVPKPVGRSSFRRNKKPPLLTRLKRSSSVGSSHQDLMENSEDPDSVSVNSGCGIVTSSTNSTSTSSIDQALGKTFGGIITNRVTGRQLVIRQFVALLTKRLHNSKRSKKGFIAEIIMPAVFIFLAVLMSTLWPGFEQYPPMELHPWLMAPKRGDRRLYTFYSNDRPGDKMVQELERLVRGRTGFSGNRCLNPTTHSISGFPCSGGGGGWSPRPMGPIPNVSVACSCASGRQVCPPGAGGPEPSMRLMDSSDYLVNLTGYNITDYLQKTYKRYLKRRYGGISLGELNFDAQIQSQVPRPNVTSIFEIMNRITRAATANRTQIQADDDFWARIQRLFDSGLEVRNNLKVWFLNKGYAAPVAYLNLANNLLLRSKLAEGADQSKYGVSTWNHPMNFTRNQLDKEARKIAAIDTMMAICVIFALAFIPASFVLFLIAERVSNSKHLQFVSGVNPNIYWLANFAWDIMNYLVPLIICILIFVIFQKQAFVSAENIGPFILLMLVYGFAIIPMMYPASFYFKTPSTAFVLLSCINLLIGMTSTLATFIIELLQNDEPDLRDVNKVLKKVFLLLPQYCLGRGLIDLSANQLEKEVASQYIDDYKATDPMSWDMLGKNVFCLVMESIFFFGLTLLIEHKFFYERWRCMRRSTELKGSENEDDDVARERERILSGSSEDDVMQVQGLTKVYRMMQSRGPAVNQLTFGVKKSECFGLLGVNGAGKTTTFKMLTGDEAVTDGDAIVNGFSILREMTSVHQQIGYCPQFDALNENLTGRETLTFFARLRGVQEQEVGGVVDWVLKRMSLTPHADKVTHKYSGGNKRKLSTAIALIGDPPIIFLDEPTSGMDPGARRFLWNCVSQAVAEGRSVVLTSHSMEECEALCHRLAIMVNGEFKCLGSNQHLKNKFGEGYTVTLRLAANNVRRDAVKEFMDESFVGCLLKEEHYNVLQFHLPMKEVQLSDVFAKVHAIKMLLGIEDYSISQTTLDQVFINFAKEQSDMLKDERATEERGPSKPTTVFVPADDSGQAYINFSDLNGDGSNSLHGSNVMLMSRGSMDSLPFAWSRAGSQSELIVADRNGSVNGDVIKTHEARFRMSDVDV